MRPSILVTVPHQCDLLFWFQLNHTQRPGGADIIVESGLVAEPSGGDTPEIGGFASSVIPETNSRAKGHLDPVAAKTGLTREPVQSKGQHFRKLQGLHHQSS